MPGRRMLLVTLLAAVLAGGSAAAQDASAGFTEYVDVELVNVEVWATDGKGRHVGGLTADDFILLHDGQEVGIDFFAEIGRESAAGATAVPSSSSTEAHLIVYFDELNLHPSNRKLLIDALKEFLSSSSVPPERVLVLRQARSLFVESPFGARRSDLEAALRRLEAAGPLTARSVATADMALRQVEEAWRSSEETAGSASTAIAGIPDSGTLQGLSGGTSTTSPRAAVGGPGTGGGLSSDTCDVFLGRISPMIEGFARERAAEVAVTLERLSEAVTFLSGLEGVKFLLYLSDRLETSPGMDVASVVQGYCPTGQQSYLMGTLAEEMSKSFLELTRHANANRVTLYAMQGEGLRPGASGSASQRGGPPRRGRSSEGAVRANERGGLIVLADETGGRAIFNRSDFESELEDIAYDMDTHYSLAFRPPPSDGDGRHTIEVKVRDRSIDTRYRKSYQDKTADDRLEEQLLGALNLGLVSNTLDVRLGAGTVVPRDGGVFSVPLQVLVPADRLTYVPEGDSSAADLALKLTIHEPASGSLLTHDGNFKVPRPPEVAGQWVPLSLNLSLPEGFHSIAVGVRDEGSREVSVVSTSLKVGDPEVAQ